MWVLRIFTLISLGLFALIWSVYASGHRRGGRMTRRGVWKPFPYHRRSIAPISAITAILISSIFSLNLLHFEYTYILDYHRLILVAALASMGLLCTAVIFGCVYLKNDRLGRRDFAVISFVASVMFSLLVVRQLNTVLDSSWTTMRVAQVIGSAEGRSIGGLGYDLELVTKAPHEKPRGLPVGIDTYWRIGNGALVTIVTHAGLFHIPWEDIDLDSAAVPAPF